MADKINSKECKYYTYCDKICLICGLCKYFTPKNKEANILRANK